jgi:error-prone DNA polymerase
VLIPRVHERYGREHCALVAAFATFRVRSAVRDFAKALGLPPGEIERLARAVDPWKPSNDIEEDVPRGGSPRWDALVRLAREAAGLPRHVSQHPGGMVIATQPLIDLCPVQPASMEGRQMVQWTRTPAATPAFSRSTCWAWACSPRSSAAWTRSRVCAASGSTSRASPYDDQEVYARIQEAETTGVFQIERARRCRC